MTADSRLQEFSRLIEQVEDFKSPALKEIEELANNRFPPAMIFVAEAMRTGTAFYERDVQKSEGWYEIARSVSPVQAAHGLGQIQWARGEYTSAYSHFSEAATHCYGPSLNMLGIMCIEGKGTIRDREAARIYWQRGISVGNFWSLRNLGRQMVRGQYGTVLIPLGVAYLVRAAGWVLHLSRQPYSDRLKT
jgi:TPR repeat protein